MPEVTISTKFYTAVQNNSGGHYDEKPEFGIGLAICVEAINHHDARSRLQRIIEQYNSGSCECCGDRWDTYFFDDEGTESPSIYDAPLTYGYVHYLDGSIKPAKETPDV